MEKPYSPWGMFIESLLGKLRTRLLVPGTHCLTSGGEKHCWRRKQMCRFSAIISGTSGLGVLARTGLLNPQVSKQKSLVGI